MRGRRGPRVIFGVGTAVLLAVGATTAIQAQRADSIKVHGHWTIDVRNADGTLASHNEIENELQPTGTSALTGLLAGNYTAPRWRIQLSGAEGSGACVRSLAPPPSTPLSSLVITPPEDRNVLQLIDTDPVHMTNDTPFQWHFNAGEPLVFSLEALVPTSDTTITVGPGQPPGFSMAPVTWQFPQQGTGGIYGAYGRVDFTFDSSAATPGSYTFPITGSRPVLETVATNVYMVTVNLVPPEPPDPGLSGPYPCSAVAPGTAIPYEFGNAWFPTVGVAIVDVPPGQNLEISGNVTAAFADAITQVTSLIVLNNSTLAFSARTLATPIQVAVGQRIYVKVAFSFS